MRKSERTRRNEQQAQQHLLRSESPALKPQYGQAPNPNHRHGLNNTLQLPTHPVRLRYHLSSSSPKASLLHQRTHIRKTLTCKPQKHSSTPRHRLLLQHPLSASIFDLRDPLTSTITIPAATLQDQNSVPEQAASARSSSPTILTWETLGRARKGLEGALREVESANDMDSSAKQEETITEVGGNALILLRVWSAAFKCVSTGRGKHGACA